GIGSEDVGRKADVRIFLRDVAHDAKRLLAMVFSLARIAENNVEHDMNTGQIGLACCFHHLLDMLKPLVHESQHLLEGRLGTKADVVHPTFGKQADVVFRHQCEEVSRGLEIPAKLNPAGKNSFRDCHGTLSVYQEVGIEQRDMLDVVPWNQLGKVVHNS